MGIKKSILRLNNKKIEFNKLNQDKIKQLRVQRNLATTGGEKLKLNLELQNFNRYSYVSQIRKRCLISGRARGVQNRYGLCRMKLLEYAAKGYLSGIKKD